MDCPHLLHLGFLLLALAAPQPNVALFNVGSAVGTENYYTPQEIYCCMNCKNFSYDSGANNFGKLKYTKTQNNASSEVIHLMFNKTHIAICFDERNSDHEGHYKLILRKPEGSGESCGIPSSGAFSENGRGGISSEKTNYCEAEADIGKQNHDLNCFYAPRHNKAPAGTTDGAGSFLWCLRGSSWLGTPACFAWMLCFLLLYM